MPQLEKQILEYLEKNLPGNRYNHICGVVELADKLAKRHGLNARKARLAGALHDVARCWNAGKLRRYAKTHRLQAPDLKFLMKHQPNLLHAYVGADLARREFGVRDKDILSAVSKHSLGAMQMSRFDHCVYLADLLAPDRTFYGVDDLRKLAFKDMKAAFREGVAAKIRYVLKCNEPLHPEVIRIWNHVAGKNSGRSRVGSARKNS